MAPTWAVPGLFDILQRNGKKPERVPLLARQFGPTFAFSEL